jgi:glycerophosphoryl diester phosphodiesterase
MTSQPHVTRPFFQQAKFHPEVIAHRGGAGQWPGETIYAFEQARQLGVDVLEMDVHATADGELVLMHNKAVNDTTEGDRRVTDMTLAEIKKLDAGYRWTADGQTYPFRGQGLTVPTLREVFEQFGEMRLNIEIKQKHPSLIAPFVELIREFGMTDKILVASFWSSALDEFRRACPDVATSASTPEAIKFFLLNEVLGSDADRPETDAIQADSEISKVHIITKKFIERAHHLNLQVHGWTVNEPQEMERLIALGVDGIITDYPGPLLSLLGRSA